MLRGGILLNKSLLDAIILIASASITTGFVLWEEDEQRSARAFAPKGRSESSAVCEDEMKQDNRQTQLILCLFGILPVAWLGLLIAPAVSGGLPEIITAFPAAMNDPFHIVLCEDQTLDSLQEKIWTLARKNDRCMKMHC